MRLPGAESRGSNRRQDKFGCRTRSGVKFCERLLFTLMNREKERGKTEREREREKGGT